MTDAARLLFGSRPTTTIATMWDDFARRVIPPTAPALQVSEMKMAFYSGALVGFNAILALDPGDEPTDADLVRMDALYREINSFIVDEIGRRFGRTPGHG